MVDVVGKERDRERERERERDGSDEAETSECTYTCIIVVSTGIRAASGCGGGCDATCCEGNEGERGV